MAELTIAFFGTGGDFSLPTLRALARTQRVVAIVRARARGGSALRRLLRRVAGSTDPLAAFARRERIPLADAASRDDPAVTRLLARARPDLICIAGHRWILPPEVLALAPLGGLNLHASLLPRHRGILPLFWIYHRDDRETGVTVHVAAEHFDTGDVAGQAAFSLPRGLPVGELNRRNGDRGAVLMAECVRRLSAGDLVLTRQDERLVTHAPFVRPGTPMTDFGAWDVERVWHFLGGLHPWFQEPLRAHDGRALGYRGVAGFACGDHGREPGTVDEAPGGFHLYCRGGTVSLLA